MTVLFCLLFTVIKYEPKANMIEKKLFQLVIYSIIEGNQDGNSRQEPGGGNKADATDECSLLACFLRLALLPLCTTVPRTQ